MKPDETEFTVRDAQSVLLGLDWRISAAMLTVPGVLIGVPLRNLFPEFWGWSVVLFLLAVFLLGQGVFAFGAGRWLRKWCWVNRIAFVCDSNLLIICASFLPLSLGFSGIPGPWLIFWTALAVGIFFRTLFYGLLAWEIGTGRVASLLYGLAFTIFLISVFMVLRSFRFTETPAAWSRIWARIFSVSALVSAASFTCMVVRFRRKLNRFLQSQPKGVPSGRFPLVFQEIFLLLLLFGAALAYGQFWSHVRVRLEEAKEQNVLAESPKPPQSPEKEKTPHDGPGPSEPALSIGSNEFEPESNKQNRILSKNTWSAKQESEF